jgi:hypothetical protein
VFIFSPLPLPSCSSLCIINVLLPCSPQPINRFTTGAELFRAKSKKPAILAAFGNRKKLTSKARNFVGMPQISMTSPSWSCGKNVSITGTIKALGVLLLLAGFAGKVLYAASPAAAAATKAAASTGISIPPSFFGMTTLNYNKTNPLIRGTIRSMDVSYPLLNWATINPAAGVYEWGALDSWVAAAQAQQQDIIFLLGGTPTWASQCPGDYSAINNPGSNCPPMSTSSWTNWVTAVATRYRGKIKYYELWNEPNDARSWPVGNPNAAQLMAQMAQLAHTALKAADPNALLTTPSYTGILNAAMLDKVLSYGTSYYDAVSFHSYGNYDFWYSAEFMGQIIQQFAAVAGKYGMGGLPFVSTEGSWGTGQPYITDLNGQADFLVKFFVLHAAYGVNVTTWYAVDASPAWGQLENANGLNPAGVAYQTVHSWLSGGKVWNIAANPNGTYFVNITQPNGVNGVIVWNSLATVNLPTPGLNRATRVNGQTISIPNGVLSVGSSPMLLTASQ